VEPDDQLWQIALKVRPGITNLAALAFRNEEELLAPADDPDAYYRATILPEKLRLDIEYQRTRSLFRDFKLLWLTVRYSFCPGGFDCDRILKSFST
jgi:lipopolysaccharide/colanic/teichoic acid biosynthesis glycosyltransferase